MPTESSAKPRGKAPASAASGSARLWWAAPVVPSHLRECNLWRRRAIDLTDLGPLYHDYSAFGARNVQLPGIFGPNQRAKAPILSAYVLHALAKFGGGSFIELFCADGYYAMLAARFGAARSVGLDDHSQGGFTETGPKIAARLGLKVEFRRADVLEETERFDIVANVGGLYHVSDPRTYLAHSGSMARRFLIVQSVVSLATNDPDYFVAPAPGQHWGNRMSRASFDRMVAAVAGFRVRDAHFNELEGNSDPKDRGSAYYLMERS